MLRVVSSLQDLHSSCYRQTKTPRPLGREALRLNHGALPEHAPLQLKESGNLPPFWPESWVGLILVSYVSLPEWIIVRFYSDVNLEMVSIDSIVE